MSTSQMASIYVDDFDSIKQQIPKTVDFGTVNVEILALCVTSDLLVLGSSCGTVFLFDRADGKLQRQLRTSSTGLVSCLSVLGNQIAVGHHSGTLVLIQLPTRKNKKVDQYTDSDQHRGSAITHVIWSTKDSTKIVSTDENGIAILTNVNFHKKEFTHSFLFCEAIPSAIRCVDVSEDRALICCENNQCSLVVFEGADVALVGEQTSDSSQLMGVAWMEDDEFSLFYQDFRVFVYKTENLGTPMKIFSLLEKMQKSFISSVFINGEALNADFERPSSMRWLASSESHCCFLTNLNQILLLRTKNEITVEMAFYLGDLKIIDAAYFDRELFLLHSNRDLLRISTRRVSFQEIQIDEPTSGNLSSIVDSTSNILHRVLPPKDVTVRETIEEVTSRGMEVISTRIAPSLNQLLDNMRKHVDNSNFGAEEGQVIIDPLVLSGRIDEIEVAEDVSLENAVSVIRKEKGQKKKKRRKSMDGSDISGQSDENPRRSESPQNDVEEKLKNVRMVVAQMGTGRGSPDRSSYLFSSSPRPFQPSPLAQRREIPESGSPSSPVPSSSTTDEANQPVETDSEEEDEALDEERALKLLLERTAVSASTDSQSTLSLGTPTEESPQKMALQKEKHEKAVVVNDLVDIWHEVQLPFTPSWLSANTSHLFMCHRKKNPKWALIEDLNIKMRLEWTNAHFMANQLETNEDGSLIWKINKGVPKMSTELCPTISWIPVENCSKGAAHCALAAKDAWYSTENKISLQMELPEEGFLYETEGEARIRSISATRRAVWAIREETGTLMVRVGINRCRMGSDWVDVNLDLDGRFLWAKLVETTGFLLDENGGLWMAKGVDEHHPYGNADGFMRVCTPLEKRTRIPPPSEWRLAASPKGLFISAGRKLFCSRVAVSGHRFSLVVPPKIRHYDRFTMLSAGAFLDENSNGIFACRPNSELFGFKPLKKIFSTYMLPLSNGQSSTIISLQAVPDRLVLLDSCGGLFEKKLLNGSLSEAQWTPIDTEGRSIISVSVSDISLWAITASNEIIVRLEDPSKWHSIDSPKSAKIEEVRCSRNGRYVWVISSSVKRMWARSAIAELTPSGIKWIEACQEPPMLELCVGNNVVWGLAADATLYRLRGLSATNPAGNYWRALPVKLRAISVDASNSLWAVDEEGSLVRHVTDVYKFSDAPAVDFGHQSAFEFI